MEYSPADPDIYGQVFLFFHRERQTDLVWTCHGIHQRSPSSDRLGPCGISTQAQQTAAAPPVLGANFSIRAAVTVAARKQHRRSLLECDFDGSGPSLIEDFNLSADRRRQFVIRIISPQVLLLFTGIGEHTEIPPLARYHCGSMCVCVWLIIVIHLSSLLWHRTSGRIRVLGLVNETASDAFSWGWMAAEEAAPLLSALSYAVFSTAQAPFVCSLLKVFPLTSFSHHFSIMLFFCSLFLGPLFFFGFHSGQPLSMAAFYPLSPGSLSRDSIINKVWGGVLLPHILTHTCTHTAEISTLLHQRERRAQAKGSQESTFSFYGGRLKKPRIFFFFFSP